MNWLSMLGLDALRDRWHDVATEGVTALGDRIALASLEWHAQRRRLIQAVFLTLIVAALTVVVLVSLSLVVLAYFWDTAQRMSIVWGLITVWLLIWATALIALLSILHRIRLGFSLTKKELAKDWQDIKERL